jgi:serine/threonine-protein kinase
VGEQFDKYQLLARLATGGMAELFVARLIGASGFRKNVVIKRILPHVAHDENFTRMFLDEAITCAQINHPNVCQVFELCKTEDSHFLVLEHLEGATVGSLIRRCVEAKQQVNLRLAAGIIVQACDGLHAAHEQVDANDKNVGLVHRDVSPGNLFVTVDGIVKLLDFGIAKAAWMSRKTRTGTLLGKCEYMSPEQARGTTPVDRRSDVFSLGVIAWEMLCGRRLFRRESEYETLRAVLRAPIERPSFLRPTVPEAFDNAIMRALERDPDARFRNASEFRHAIADALRDRGGPTPMCDIAPIIRTSFADQLRMQRALIKEATRQTQGRSTAVLRKAPKGTLPGTHDTPAPPAPRDTESTDVQASLPSLSPGSDSDPETMELTFRATPRPQPAGRLVPPKVPARAPQEPPRGLLRPSGTITLPERPHSISASGSVIASAASGPSPQQRPSRTAAIDRSNTRQQLVLLVVVGLLGAALATAVATIYYGDTPGGAAPSTPKIVNTVSVPNPVAPASKKEKAVAPPVPSHASASKNEEAKAKLLAANTAGRRAIVTSLDPVPNTGTVSIRSSKTATIYLYPSKEIIGTTPLIDYRLPAGTHKFKAQIGPGKRKYFHLKVEAKQRTARSFTHWK